MFLNINQLSSPEPLAIQSQALWDIVKQIPEQVKARRGALPGLSLMKKGKFFGGVKVKMMVEFKILREACKANTKINPYLTSP